MVTTHNLGFPRIGEGRQLKFALEQYWTGDIDAMELERVAEQLRCDHWNLQAELDWIPVGDFSLYDHVLDMSFTLGCLPMRATIHEASDIDRYFQVARGRSAPKAGSLSIAASEMTKWFNTNYHYLVPEFSSDTEFHINFDRLEKQIAEAKTRGIQFKPVILGPVSYLHLGKHIEGGDRLKLLEPLVAAYGELLNRLASSGATWVQIDEPALVLDLSADWQHAYNWSYHQLKGCAVQILLTTYFDSLGANNYLAANLPVAGLHIDATTQLDQVQALINVLPASKVLSLGVINGRNVWRTDLIKLLNWLEPLAEQLGNRLWLAPSCALLHVPVNLELETEFPNELKSCFAFAKQKLEELTVIARALNEGRESVFSELQDNQFAVSQRQQADWINRPAVQARLKTLPSLQRERSAAFAVREAIQAKRFQLPLFPTTTIGSFPQTKSIRASRKQLKQGSLSHAQYLSDMKLEVARCVSKQEELGLDVLVHGEPERNDMVEYFGEQLDGYAFSQHGWVQSYGSRCVKPPIIFGDVERKGPMTVFWSEYAQSLTAKPMKAMLTGPVTLLNWSFVRDDQPRELTCKQLALAIREEVLDLEKAGIGMIQIDEPALREGLPLKESEHANYLRWAVDCFKVSANAVGNETQIHTHMCYSEFNDIIEHIAALDADVITIETARSAMELLAAFETYKYPNAIGPGVYDIHSPNTPKIDRMKTLLLKACERLPTHRIWVNPDCGLKTRQWSEVEPALQNMIEAAKQIRSEIAQASSMCSETSGLD